MWTISAGGEKIYAGDLDEATDLLVRDADGRSRDLSADWWPELYWESPDSFDLDDGEEPPVRRDATSESVARLAAKVWDVPVKHVSVAEEVFDQAVLRRARAAMGASQGKMADRFGVNQATWGRWESGRSRCPAGVAGELEQVVGEFVADIEAARADERHVCDPLWAEAALFWAER